MEGTGAALADKAAGLEAEIAALSAPPKDRGDISFGKRVGEGTSAAVDRLDAVAAHDKLQRTLADVRRAQAKLADGTYGLCDVCAEPIPAARLEALPWASRCVQHASR